MLIISCLNLFFCLSIFINLGENVDINKVNTPNIDLVNIKTIEELNNYSFVIEEFPTITEKTDFKEQGLELFMKLTSDIGRKNDDDAKKADEVFTKKTPVITTIFILINLLFFIASFVLGQNFIVGVFGNQASLVKSGEFYRLITAAFVHINFVHFLFNMYALYIIGPQLENFFGKKRYALVYLISAVVGNLLSIAFNDTAFSIGASGAIFGLLGALLYFGYHYRIYLDSVIKSQIIPLIIINLFLGLLLKNIDSFGHIGGLVGGILAAWAVGVKHKSTKTDMINGTIMLIIFICFILFLIYSR